MFVREAYYLSIYNFLPSERVLEYLNLFNGIFRFI